VKENEDVELAPEFDNQTAKALAKLVYDVVADPEKRAEFREHPIETAREAGVKITDKTTHLINALHAMSDHELDQLLDLNHRLIDYGVYVETGNPPLMVF
jgi:hypothetical protein